MSSAVQDRSELSKHWWLFLVEGILIILLGILLLMNPAMTTTVLVQFLGAFWVVGGIIDLVGSLMHRSGSWGWRLAAAILGIIAGMVVLFWPLVSTAVIVLFLFYVLIIGAIVSGAINIIAGLRGPGTSWGHFFWGLLQVVLGIFLLFRPAVGAVGFIYALALFAIMGGVLMIVLAFRARSAA